MIVGILIKKIVADVTHDTCSHRICKLHNLFNWPQK